MKKRVFSIIIVLAVLAGIIFGAGMKSEAKEAPLRVDAMFQYVAPEGLSTEYDYVTDGREVSEFSISLPDNKCCIIISEKDEVYESTAYRYLGFLNDVFYFEEL